MNICSSVVWLSENDSILISRDRGWEVSTPVELRSPPFLLANSMALRAGAKESPSSSSSPGAGVLRPLVVAGVDAPDLEASLAALAARRFCFEAERADMMGWSCRGVGEGGGGKDERREGRWKRKKEHRSVLFSKSDKKKKNKLLFGETGKSWYTRTSVPTYKVKPHMTLALVSVIEYPCWRVLRHDWPPRNNQFLVLVEQAYTAAPF